MIKKAPNLAPDKAIFLVLMDFIYAIIDRF